MPWYKVTFDLSAVATLSFEADNEDQLDDKLSKVDSTWFDKRAVDILQVDSWITERVDNGILSKM